MEDFTLDALLMDDDLPDVADREPVDPLEMGDCSYPHIVMTANDLRKILRIASVINQAVGRADIPHTVGFEVEGDTLKCYMTDVDNYIHLSIPLQNSSNLIEGYFGLHYDILSKASGVVPSTVIIYCRDKRYFMGLEGGDFELSVQDNVAKKSLLYDGLDRFKEIGTIDSTQLMGALKSLSPLSSASIVPSQQSIYFGVGTHKNKAYAMFNHCVARFDGSNDFPEFTVSKKNNSFRLLLLLLDGGDCGPLVVERDDELSKFRIGNESFYYIFESGNYKLPVVDRLDTIFDDHPLTKVDYKHLSNIADLASGIHYSLSMLEFNYLEDGYISCSMLTKRTDSNFVLKGSPGETKTPKAKALQVPSVFLKVILKVFTTEEIGLVLYDKGLGMVSGDNTAVIFGS